MSKKPNVILVLTDDQGYPAFGCSGNPYIKTPNVDAFYEESPRFTDFHVAPLCAPTRGMLMTGRRPLRNGVWATCWGRSILKEGEYTVAECMRDNGYITGMFGKWHLGDNYPSRPEDKGFETVVAHKGGGVGQSPDFWGNDYFDDTYFENGKPKQYSGYCTDVWFDQAKKFILANKDSDKPFFAYIATNAPHGPYLVEQRYTDLYKDEPNVLCPEFYGMITNIDENFGELRKFLQENNIEDDTILMFTTDNGSSAGYRKDENQFSYDGYGAGMRGSKASYYEGGHKVPLIMRWANGKLDTGRDIENLVMGTDLFPTLVDLCGIENQHADKLDGISQLPAINGEKMPERTDFLQYRQDTIVPEKWTNAVLCDNWRLVYGKELYNVAVDPGQREDVAEKYPEIVEKLRQAHEVWWEEISEEVEKYAPIVLGNKAENPAVLNPMDVLGDVAWNQMMVAKNCDSAGKWNVRFDEVGKYRFSLMRWPEELKKKINEDLSNADIEELCPNSIGKSPVLPENVTYKAANLKLFGKEYSKEISGDDVDITFIVDVDCKDETILYANFTYDDDKTTGTYYVTVEKL